MSQGQNSQKPVTVVVHHHGKAKDNDGCFAVILLVLLLIGGAMFPPIWALIPLLIAGTVLLGLIRLVVGFFS